MALLVFVLAGLVFAIPSGKASGVSLEAYAAAPLVQDGTLAIVGAGGADLYEVPGGNVIKELPAGAVLTAVGRSSDNAWVVVSAQDGATGWMQVADVVIFGVEGLPVMLGAEPAPAAGQTPSAIEEPVALPTPTPTKPPTPTPTPSPSPTPSPTPPPTPTPAPTRMPERAASIGVRGSQVAVVRAGGVELVAAPGGAPVQELPTGTALTVSGQSADGQWLLVQTSSGAAGWVETEQVVIFNLESVPVVAESAAETITGENTGGEPSATPLPAEEGAAGSTLDQEPDAPAEGVDPEQAMDGKITATVTLTDSRLNVRTGPGTAYRVVKKAQPGEALVAVGRNEPATWVEVELADGDAGWVAVEYVELSAPIETLPIRDVPDDPPVTAAVTQPVAQTAAPDDGLSGVLVFQNKAGEAILVYDFATGSLRELTSGIDPAISPDGSTVVFSREGGDNGIFLIGIDGSSERLIYSGNEMLRGPKWSSDGNWIVFSRAQGEYECRDVGFGICLPDNPFLRGFPLDKRPELVLSRIDRDGQNFQDLPTLTSSKAPDWGNPRGIVYQSNTSIEITQDAPGATTTAVVQEPYYQDPAWQPDGERIVFQSREGNHWEIFVVNPDGSGRYALTRPVTTLVDRLPNNVAPAYSPDGQWIVYLSSRDENNSDGPWRIWVMRADGSEQRPLGIDVPIDYSYSAEQMLHWGRKAKASS